ncbi:MAG: hypothetical protein H0T73_01865 [Ardenticatenales bacterium]|nr:hypothetical protein [Ardenticatenales bacterium]
MQEFTTIEELRTALDTDDPNEVMIKAKRFLDRKVKEKDPETKQLLLHISGFA